MKPEDYWHKVKITGWKHFFHMVPKKTIGYVVGHWSGYVYNVQVGDQIHRISSFDFKPYNKR